MRRQFAGWLLAVGTMVGLASPLPAQQPGPDTGTGSAVLLRREIAAAIPQLKRSISLRLEGVTLERALETIARQADLPITYNDAILPRERRVWLTADDIRTDAALERVLRDSGLQLLPLASGQLVVVRRHARLMEALQGGTVVGRVTDAKTTAAIAGATVVVEGTSRTGTTGTDGRYRIADVAPGTYALRARYIGYAPGSASVTVVADQEATADLALEKSAQRLDEVVTTGTVVPTEVKALPTPISVVTADDIQRQNLQRVDQIFRGQVPGAIAWDQGPGNDYYSTVSVRGTSTLSSIPGVKTFIDGVEVANPQFIATIDPNSIDRIEITRGPQASTLYGSGALSGVMQIFTKKGEPGKRPEVTAKASGGGIQGFDGRSSALETDNTVSVAGGGEQTAYNVGGFYRRTGEWVPVYGSTDWGVSAGVQTTQGPLKLSSSLRYSNKSFDYPWDTRLQGYSYYSKPFYQAYDVRQQTYGVTAQLQLARGWQHTLTLGYDQTYYATEQTQPRFTTPADSFLSADALHEAKISLLYHSDWILRLGGSVSATLTGGVNYVSDDYVDATTLDATHLTGFLDGTALTTREPWTNTGYFGQAQLDIGERLFLTGGVRAERNDNFGAAYGTAWSPRVGAAYVFGLGPATVKLRASYGEGIRPPAPGWRDAQRYPTFQYLANPSLAPERLRGGDGGVEVYLGRASLGATYYRQRAIDLIQAALVPSPPGGLLTYQFQNLAKVDNNGWEFEGRLPLGPVQLAGTYSITHSTVRQLSPGYTGDYKVGDPLLGIPRHTAGATVTYSPLDKTIVTATLTHLGHWVENDYFALYDFYFGIAPYRGSQRAYWIEYPTVTKLAVGVSQGFTKAITGFVHVENIGNSLRSEQFGYNIPVPRTVTVGAIVRY